MTANEIAAVLTGKGWVMSTGTNEGFRVAPGKQGVIVFFCSPMHHGGTVTRMLKNYERSLADYEVTRLKSHLLVTGKK